jgi:hypothetical protein
MRYITQEDIDRIAVFLHDRCKLAIKYRKMDEHVSVESIIKLIKDNTTGTKFREE